MIWACPGLIDDYLVSRFGGCNLWLKGFAGIKSSSRSVLLTSLLILGLLKFFACPISNYFLVVFFKVGNFALAKLESLDFLPKELLFYDIEPTDLFATSLADRESIDKKLESLDDVKKSLSFSDSLFFRLPEGPSYS